MRAQVKQGYMGGKNGPLGYLMKKKESKGKKFEYKPKYEDYREVTITVDNATLYVATDSNGLSDPYVKVYASKKKGILSTTHLFTTSVQSKTLSPVWNHSETVSLCPEHIHDYLIFELYDKDILVNDFIGKGRIMLNKSGYSNFKLDLFDKDNNKIINAQVYGSIKVNEGHSGNNSSA
ncbi:C2 domain-containing protein [Tieghemostelium lacteum]|uniref:C2 domain-containing protein n=1 Tax=Tieghemostelium lacteum TaxID=361077 RepID=A0A152A9T0_TIELA|nr:C2 domain-containing protein [Tieghemostelium lacteum]|eukprot:KYR02979.1 C2 domain-containing protein [Tieghemostelium lacteum]